MKHIFCIYLLFGWFGCTHQMHEEAAIIEISYKEKKLNCQLASMKDSITKEWDNINDILEKNLPEEMPEQEKINMIKVRNANLIRMFQSFDYLDESVKLTLDETEQRDVAMTKRINRLKGDIQEIEIQKMELFSIINEKFGSEEVARLRKLNKVLLDEKCE